MFARIAMFTVIYLSASFALAQEDSAKTGRMPDGRAYRTDSQGVVMVDYIAELELETDSLRRQVQGLEGELEDFRNGVAVVSTKPHCPEKTCPERVCPEKICPAAYCPEKICPAQAECPKVNQVLKTCDVEASLIKQLEAQVAKLNNNEQILSDKLNVTALQLNAVQQRESTILAENRALKKDLTARASINIEKVQEHTAVKPALPVAATNRAEPRLEESRRLFVGQVRSDLISQLDTLQKLVAKRDARYSSFKANYTGAVSLAPQRIEFQDGQKLSDARSAIQNENSMRNLSDYGRQIKELMNKVNFEIGMMDRLQSAKDLNQ